MSVGRVPPEVGVFWSQTVMSHTCAIIVLTFLYRALYSQEAAAPGNPSINMEWLNGFAVPTRFSLSFYMFFSYGILSFSHLPCLPLHSKLSFRWRFRFRWFPNTSFPYKFGLSVLHSNVLMCESVSVFTWVVFSWADGFRVLFFPFNHVFSHGSSYGRYKAK